MKEKKKRAWQKVFQQRNRKGKCPLRNQHKRKSEFVWAGEREKEAAFPGQRGKKAMGLLKSEGREVRTWERGRKGDARNILISGEKKLEGGSSRGAGKKEGKVGLFRLGKGFDVRGGKGGKGAVSGWWGGGGGGGPFEGTRPLAFDDGGGRIAVPKAW